MLLHLSIALGIPLALMLRAGMVICARIAGTGGPPRPARHGLAVSGLIGLLILWEVAWWQGSYVAILPH